MFSFTNLPSEAWILTCFLLKFQILGTSSLELPAMLGWFYYGVLLFQTMTSDLSSWVRGVFAVTFTFWLLALVGLVLFAIEYWREKNQKN